MMAEALAAGGHTVFYVTNNMPVFYEDLSSFPHHGDIRMQITPDFESNLPEGSFDIVVLVPGSKDPGFYLAVQDFALERGARLVLLNFESGNWFNALSPAPRRLADWKHWKSASRDAAMVLSISQEGSKHARSFYTRCPSHTRFEHFYPPINTLAADSVGPVEREKRALVIARFTMAEHKGVSNLPDVICEALRGYTLVLMVGMGDIPNALLGELNARAKEHGLRIEIKHRLSDVEKFRELKRAGLLLFPSLFEGYGLPPIEAQYCDCPCIAFDLPVLRETSGDGLIYAKHGDWRDFRRKIEETVAAGCRCEGLKERVAEIAGLDHCKQTLDSLFRGLLEVPPLADSISPIGRRRLAFRRSWSKRGPSALTREGARELLKKVLTALGDWVKKWRANHLVSGSVCYYPPFASQEELANHYYRARWYLPRVPKRCEQVFLFQTFGGTDAKPGPRPEHMCEAPTDGSHIVIRQGWLENIKMVFRSQLVLVWRDYKKHKLTRFAELFVGVKVVNVDIDDLDSKEYGAYCSLIWKWLTSEKDRQLVLQQNRRRFEAVAEEIEAKQYRRACVFGTGPSLEDALQFDYSGCLTIVCNTIVQNDALLDHLEPAFVCAGDVISHFGLSTYARKFREDLIRALKTRDLYLFTTASFAPVLLFNHPEIEDKVILIDQTFKGPNYNLRVSFGAPQLDSTLNIHMLPLASTFVKEIWILGCDGKSKTRSNEDFWAHAEGAQYHDLVDTGHLCHPTFDVHRQKSTYPRFLKSVEETVLTGEREHGIVYRCLRPSNVPVLAERSVLPEFLERPGWAPPYRIEDLSVLVATELRDRFPEVSPTDAGQGPEVDPDLPCRIGVSKCTLDEDGVLYVAGWAIAPSPIDKIVVTANGKTLGAADYGLRRVDVLRKYPEYRNELCGFLFLDRLETAPEDFGPIKVEVYSGGRLLGVQERKLKRVKE